jgi:2-polyprenyl-3-methyl-5-hydroxy-6-metoxy-1,4-benzoquinol methylase
MDFSVRSKKLELLDQPGIPSEDIERNMQELSIINQKLGGHFITWQGFIKLAQELKVTHVCEIGCGGGDNLKAIEEKGRRQFPGLKFTGIDLNADCIRIAERTEWKSPARFIVNDYRKILFDAKPDIIFCALFCHHFKENEIIQMFRWMKENSRSGFFVNDLHRHPLAYFSIRWLTSIFSRSYLVKHDAPLSVLRGFKKKELVKLLHDAGIINFTMQWKWAFRWLVIVYP